jgi:hypothetical protein
LPEPQGIWRTQMMLFVVVVEVVEVVVVMVSLRYREVR